MNTNSFTPENDDALEVSSWLESRPREPDSYGISGKAWQLHPEEATPPQQAATLATWLVHRPNAHPFWEWWTVTIVHLRNVQGLPDAERAYPEAEYEFQIRTIDPEEDPEPNPDLVDEGYAYLEPPDVIEQFHGLNDRQAESLCNMAIQAILNGDVSPGASFRTQWSRLIRDQLTILKAIN